MTLVRMLLTLGAVVALLAATPVGADDAGGGWFVVEYTGRIEQADRDWLDAAGAESISYRPVDAYVAWLPSPDAVRTLPRVQRVRALTPAEKVQPDLDDAGVRDAVLVSVRAPTARAVAARISERWGVRARYAAGDGLVNLVVAAPLGAARSLAAVPEVRYVGPVPGGLVPLDEMGDQIMAGNLAGSAVPPGYEQWLAGHALDGSGVRVAVVDTGIDRHPDFGDRIVARLNLSQVPVTGEPVDVGGHGTHVAGIVGGAAVNVPGIGRVADGNGHLYGLGMAPKVGLVDVNAIAVTSGNFLCGGGWTPRGGWKTLTQGALGAQASIWNASWRTCEGAGIGYVDSSRNLDLLVRDGDPDKAGEQPFTMVFAAGNAGGPRQRIEAPSEAKNTIVVAASTNARGGNPATIARFSSRGPAKDGRILPTVAAPGASVASARTFAGVSCNVPILDSFGLYALCSGTSMASPHVAGATALLTQWWRRDHDGADPSPALTKALLVNTATDMRIRDIPNIEEGWGRVNLGTLFDPEAVRVVDDQETVLTAPDEARTYRVNVADPAKPLRVTLVWTDPAAAAGAQKALVNDLDLQVVAPNSDTYHGNRFAGGRSTTTGAPDRLNNVENVFIDGADGEYVVTVSAYDVPSDGAPSVGDLTDQDYALVISNAALVPSGSSRSTTTGA